MTTLLNAAAGLGFTTTSDGSGVVKLQSNGVTTNSLVWGYINGTSPTIRASYNISSITKIGTGQYQPNFTNALSDTNYAILATSNTTDSGNVATPYPANLQTVSATQINTYTTSITGAPAESTRLMLAIFGN